MCCVKRFFYKTPKKVFWKEVPHSHMPGENRIHMVDETDIPNKPRKEEKYTSLFSNDCYEGIVIDDDIFIRCRKKPVVLRSVDRFGDVHLPVMGIAAYSKGRKPYSVVWSTRDIQKMWNIVHFHKELWIALSGVKTVIVDYSQKPAGMSDTEWNYHRKMGVLQIQTVNPENGQVATYNQFKDYDAGLSQGYALLMKTADHLDALADKAIGMSPQRMGDVSPYDKVGTAEKAIRQSTLATEHIFYDYDHVRMLAMERLVNLCRLAWRNGKVAAYVNPDSLERKILNIPPGILYGADYKMHLKSGGLEMKKLDLIRQVAMGDKAQEKISMTHLIDLFSIDSLLAVRKKSEYFEEKAQEIAMQNRQVEQMNAKDLEDYKAQKQKEILGLQGELDKTLEQVKQNIKQMELALKQKDLEFSQWQFQVEAQLKKTIEDKKVKKDLAGIESERETEFAYLDEQRRQFDLTMRAEQGEKVDTDVAGPMTIDRKRKEKIK